MSAVAGSADKSTNPVDPTASAPSPWELSAAVGFGLTDGNSDTLSLGAQILASYFKGNEEVYLGADYFHAENNSLTTTDNLRVYGTWNHLLTDRLYTNLLAEYFRDDIANLDYRVTVSPGLGYYLVKTDTLKFGLDSGAAYVWENQGTSDSYFALRFGERLEWTPNSRVKVWQGVSFVPEAGDFSNYLLVAELGIQTALSDHWALRTLLRNTYDSTPFGGAEENDLSVLAGLSYSLAGFAPAAPSPARRSLGPAPAAPPSPAKGWSNTAAIGFGLTDGNSDTLLITADYETAYRGETNEFFLHLGGGYGEQDSATSQEFFRASVQLNRLLTDRFYLGGIAPFEYDDIAGIDYRVSPTVVAGYYLVKNDTTSLALEAGPGYTFEKVGGVGGDYLSLYFGEKFATQLANGITFGQTLGFRPEAADFDNYVLEASAFLDVAVTDRLSLRTAVTNVYDNTPAPGAEKNDLRLTSGLALRF